MKTINKMLLAGLLSVTMLTAVAQEQPAEPRPEGCPMPQMAPKPAHCRSVPAEADIVTFQKSGTKMAQITGGQSNSPTTQ